MNREDTVPLKLLYVGSFWEGSTCKMRAQAMRALGHDVSPVDVQLSGDESFLRRQAQRLKYRLGYPDDTTQANERVLASVAEESFDIIWFEAAELIRPATLQMINLLNTSTRRVAFIMDDPFSPEVPCWRRFRRAAANYDLHLVVRHENIEELRRCGARAVLRYHKGYDPQTHRPRSPQEGDPRPDVFFAGGYETRREASLAHLLRSDIQVTIAGQREWGRGRNWPRIRPRLVSPMYGHAYAGAICAAKIALCFYRQCNRDQENSRMYEIPACGTFMLAERNSENRQIFSEGREAEFFSTDSELLEKVRYYLTHSEERERIAAAGLARCHNDGYDYPSRLAEILSAIENTPAERV